MLLKISVFIVAGLLLLCSSINAQNGKDDLSLPPHCRVPPKYERYINCTGTNGYRYDRQRNKCVFQRKNVCLKQGAFTTLDECVYQCYDYRKMWTKDKNKGKDICGNEIKEDEMAPPIRIASRRDDVDGFKNNRCRDPNHWGHARGMSRFIKQTYRYNKDKNECEDVMDAICIGRNRFLTKEECVHVCKWDSSSGRYRYIVRKENSRQ